MDSPSVRERRLAGELKTLRTAVGLHGNQVAATLGWSPSKVSRIETGRTGVGEGDLERLLDLYRVPPEQAAVLRALAPSVRPRGWWDAYADTMSSGYASLIRLEAGSAALQCYCALVPHALLQTPAYTRQIVEMSWRNPSRAEVDRRVQVCLRRQELLAPARRPPLRLSAVVDEAVLHRPPAGDEGRAVLLGQVEHLAQVGRLGHVTVQVLPFTAGLAPVTAGSFSTLESVATRTVDVVYLENRTRVFFIDAEAEVHSYTQEFGLLRQLALSPEDSLAVLEETAERLRG